MTRPRRAFLILMGGALGIAFAPIFVRFSQVGPSATAFHRLLWALPFLALWQALSPDPAPPGSHSTHHPPRAAWIALPGLFFAGDLAVWHWSIRLTSVANATLLGNVTPILVTLAARFLFHERITPLFLAGLALTLAGAAAVFHASVARGGHYWVGDLLGLATAVFYAGYMLSVKYLRRFFPTRRILVGSSLSACPVLLIAAIVSRETLLPTTSEGWLVLVALALVCQVAGQGLIVHAMAHLPASFSSVSLLVQPVAAAGLAWVILGEPLRSGQALGGLVVLVGIALASRASLGPATLSSSSG